MRIIEATDTRVNTHTQAHTYKSVNILANNKQRMTCEWIFTHCLPTEKKSLESSMRKYWIHIVEYTPRTDLSIRLCVFYNSSVEKLF